MDRSCLDWMAALPEELWDVPLTHLAIPGSHDSMSYCLDISSPLVPSESDLLVLLDRLCPCMTRPAIAKWATTQDKSIEEQLSMGIRFFDLRIAQKPGDPSGDLYFTHVIYTYLQVLDTLSSVASWLESHPKEIVILACSHFEGIEDELHKSFISSLKRLFGSKICPWNEPVLTLRSLWASGYQVLLSYDLELAVRHQELLSAIPYWWANNHTAQGVISYLESNKVTGRPNHFFVTGLNLTASKSYIALNPQESLRTLTFRNWECVRTWLEQQRPGSDPQSLNIVAGDFVGPLPLCPLVIGLNHKLTKKTGSHKEKQY